MGRSFVNLVGKLISVSAEALLARYRSQVDHHLDLLLPSETAAPVELHSAMRYSALAPGKRLRPALLLAAFESLSAGPVSTTALDAACAVEMVHAFSLIHDDLPAIDNDSLRRGRPTSHVKFGEGIALLAGDALFALSFETMLREPDLPRAKSALCLARASGSSGLVGGEVRDVLAEGQPFSAADVFEIHSQKTGALIAASCTIGAILSGADEAVQDQFQRFGEKVGLAFQIADDVLNETSTAERLGKSIGSDRERMKATYPALVGSAESARLAIEAVDEACTYLGTTGFEPLKLLASYSVERLH